MVRGCHHREYHDQGEDDFPPPRAWRRRSRRRQLPRRTTCGWPRRSTRLRRRPRRVAQRALELLRRLRLRDPAPPLLLLAERLLDLRLGPFRRIHTLGIGRTSGGVNPTERAPGPRVRFTVGGRGGACIGAGSGSTATACRQPVTQAGDSTVRTELGSSAFGRRVSRKRPISVSTLGRSRCPDLAGDHDQPALGTTGGSPRSPPEAAPGGRQPPRAPTGCERRRATARAGGMCRRPQL